MKFDLSDISVVIATPVRDVHDINVATAASLIGTLNALHGHGVPFEHHFHISGVLPGTRSLAVHRFLQTEANRLFWWDSDIVAKPEDFMRVLAYSTRYDVIGAVYTAKQDKPFFLIDATNEGIQEDDWGCLQINGMGMGFTCMRRPVLEKLYARARKKKFGRDVEAVPGVFRFDELHWTDYDEFRGEDMAFFEDVRGLGYTVNVDPTISLGHVGDKEYRARFGDFIKAPAVAA